MADIKKTYIYRVYRNSLYVGDLPNINSEFNYTQDINSAGSQLQVTIGNKFDDVGANVDSDRLVDESGNPIVDELGNHILTRLDYVFSNIPIDLNNRIIVTEYSSFNPNGVTVFDGFIFDWDTDYTNDNIVITVVSHGVRLDNYVLDPSSDINTSQLAYDTEVALTGFTIGSPTLLSDVWAQSFQVSSSVLLSTISIMMRKSSNINTGQIQLALYGGTPTSIGEFLGFVDLFDIPNTTIGLVNFSFSTPIQLIDGDNYFFTVLNARPEGDPNYATVYMEYKNSSVYTNGQLYNDLDRDENQLEFSPLTADMAFTLTSTTGTVQLGYVDIDPSDITRTALNVFNSKGGLVTYTSSSIDNTGLTVDYTFLLSTILETAAKGYELAPSSWYWYVDVATNLYHMHNSGGVADHRFTLGSHIVNFKISQTLATVKNTIYFSGGAIGAGQNLFRVNTDTASVTKYGQWLDRPSDNRITNNDTADVYSVAKLGKYSVPPFNVECTISGHDYDLNLIKVGQMVQLNGFNNLIDSLLLQIIGKNRLADTMILKLGIPLVRNSKLVEDLRRRLIALETVNNSPTPT